MSNPREHLRCSRKGCSYTTNRSYNLERHERNHDKGKVPVSQCQPCPHCTYAAGSVHNLMRHISKKHAILSIKKQKSIQPEQQKESQSTESIIHIEYNPEPEEETTEESHEFNNGTLQKSSLWHWSSPQQQERNFLRRSGLNAEFKILDRNINMFKLFSLVKARGGAINVNRWDDVAAALGLPPGTGRHVHAKYVDKLNEFEQNEEERLQECESVEGCPTWWDDGDYLPDKEICSEDYTKSESERPSITVRNAIVKMIFTKYYSKYLKIGKPFQRFRVKDSWLCATSLNYQALICQMHFKHYTDP